VTILHSIILGIVEGFTEFLPISSTGHMIVISSWLGMSQTDANKAFEVIIQLAAILAVVANYRDKFTLRHFDLWTKLAVAFVPIGVVGLLFHHQIKALFSVPVVAWMFIVGGVIFLVIERFHHEDRARTRDVEAVGFRQALWIGIAQVFAVIPGTSRAGATIVGGMLSGLDRRSSAEFSFLLAFPVMLAASGFDLVRHWDRFSDANLVTLAVGFVTAFIVAYLTMRLFISFLQRFTFNAFGVYRILFGGLLLFLHYGGHL